MKILVNTLGAIRGGYLTHMRKLLPSLAQLPPRHEYVVLHSKTQKEIAGLDLPHNFKKVEIAGPWAVGVGRLAWEQAGLRAIAESEQVDVVHLPLAVTSLAPPSPSVIELRNPNTFAPVREADIRYRALNFMKKWLAQVSILQASKLVFVSDWSKRAARANLKFELARAVVIYHGIDTADYGPQVGSMPVVDGWHPDRRYILTVSTIDVHKNYCRMIDGFARLCEQGESDLDYVIVGGVSSPHELQRIRSTIVSRGLQHRVRLLGEIPHTELSRIYANAALYVLPALRETFGLTLLEAMASGVPIAASQASAIPEIAGDSALYFDPYDAEDIMSVVGRALQNTREREDLIRAGKERVARFTWHEAARRYVEVFEEVLDAS